MSISINQFCDMLMGEKLLCIYRVCDMLCFDFGEYYERKNYKGELKPYSTKSLHILSNSFRVLAEKRLGIKSHYICYFFAVFVRILADVVEIF